MPSPMTRWAKSYSIVDHKLLHQGYLQELSHQALALYLFYVVVGDRNGKSFYAPRSVQQILRLSENEFTEAQSQLIACGLISSSPLAADVFVNNLGDASYDRSRRSATEANPVSERRSATKFSANRSQTWHSTQQVLKAIQRGVQRASE